MTTMQIETLRMYVRDFTPNDIHDLHEIFGDSETMKNCEPAYTFEKTRQLLGMKREGVQRSQTQNNEGNWADLYKSLTLIQ